MHGTGQARPLLLDEAVAIAADVCEWLRRRPGCAEACETGAVRRRVERLDVVEVLACGPAELLQLRDWPRASSVSGRGATSSGGVATIAQVGLR